jgi:hypothetical protein
LGVHEKLENSMRVYVRLSFPTKIGANGFFASVTTLSNFGYLDVNGAFERSLANAGFSVLIGSSGLNLEIAAAAKGVFEGGVGEKAEQLLGALAEDGFEGVVRDGATQKTWYLQDGMIVSMLDELKQCA